MPKQLTRDLLSNCCSQLSSSIKEELDRDSFACARRPVRPTGSIVQITVQYRCISVLLLGRYSLQLDNNMEYSTCHLYFPDMRKHKWLVG